MDKVAILFSKAAAAKKNLESLTLDTGFGSAAMAKHIEPWIPIYEQIGKSLKELLPDMFSDMPDFIGTKSSPGLDCPIYMLDDIYVMIRNLDYILEVRSGYRIGEKIEEKIKAKKVFISHGTSKEWYKVQAYIERDLNHKTLELEQQPNLGRTIIQKLYEESNKCNCAIIVMTGDDKFDNGEIRARENVLHEIGFFQGKLGLGNIMLLHEEGVNIPSNIHGLVYITFPKDTIEATFGGLTRELKIILV